jgi:filamentous hemagglutinin family protein
MISIKSLFSSLLGLSVSLPLVLIQSTMAQEVIPDDTLGGENSRVRRGIVRGREADLIEGGAERGRNLFHSFREFGVRDGDAAYFANPGGVENIFSRVTGSNPSNILGRLGVDGPANLFFMNPNGIVFGPNSSLDVQGSFVGTTANSFRFADGSEFSAVNPQDSSLLTVSVPVGLQYGPTPGEIAVEGASLEGGVGKTLALMGGDVRIDTAYLIAPGGPIEIGSAANGFVGLVQDGGLLSFSFPQATGGGEVSIAETSLETFADEEGASGDIRINAGFLEMITSDLTSDSFEEDIPGKITIDASNDVTLDFVSITSGSDSAPGGNIEITAGSLSAVESDLETSTFGGGDSGDILIDVRDAVELENTFLSTNALGDGGNGGNIEITVGSLLVTGGSGLNTDTAGQGNAGDITITAREDAVIQSGKFSSSVLPTATGDGGNIEVDAAELILFDEATLETATNGRGDAGNITFNVDDVVFAGGDASTAAETGASGNAGSVIVNADFFTLLDDSLLTSSTRTRGNAGSVTITASEEVNITGGKISSSVLERGEGDGGNIQITAQSIFLDNSGADPFSLSTNVDGRGDGGEITFNADDISISNSVIFSALGVNAIGSVGNVTINSNNLDVRDSQLQSQAYGRGNAGNIIINARNSVNFDNVQTFSSIEADAVGNGGNVEIAADSLTLQNSALEASTRGRGDAGNITINTGNSVAFNRSSILSSVAKTAVGNAGDVSINARDSVSFNRSSIFSSVAETAVGNAGDIKVEADSISLTNFSGSAEGAALQNFSDGQGNAGSVMLNARNSIVINDVNIFSTIGTTGTGNGGNLEISTSSLSVTDSGLSSGISGLGNAGDVIITADSVFLSGGGIYPNTGSGRLDAEGNAISDAGNIEITTGSLEVTDGAQVFTSTGGFGDAGNVVITASERVLVDGIGRREPRSSSIFSSAEGNNAIGRAGSVTITTPLFVVSNGGVVNTQTQNDQPGGSITVNANTFEARNGGQVVTTTSSSGRAGNITLNVTGDISLTGVDSGYTRERQRTLQRPNDLQGPASGLYANALEGSIGQGGTITLNTSNLRIDAGALINARTESTQRGGSIQVTADRIEATNGGQLVTSTFGAGQAGDITLNVRDSITLAGRDEAFNNRLTTLGQDFVFNEGNGESGLFANTRLGSTGNGGNITLSANSLNLLDDAQIVAFTDGTGNPGNINIRETNTVRLDNSTISTTVNSGAILSNPTSTQGNIDIQARTLELNNGGEVTSSTLGRGNAGNITVRDADIINLERGIISTTVAAGAIGQGGNIDLETGRLLLDNDSNITSSTFGQGDTGSIDITATDRIALRNDSQIESTVNRGATGNSQQITLNTPNLSLRENSGISAATDGNGQAGDIQIEANTISLNNSIISTQVQDDAIVPEDATRAQSRSTSRQGNIRIDTRSLSLNNEARITASTNGRGRAGDVTVNNAERISLNGESKISSRVERVGEGQGIGRGGNITLNTDILTLDNSEITGSTNGQGNAGNVIVNGARQITLDNDSRITSAVRADGQGQGGNVRLQTGSLSLNNSRVNTSTSGQGRAGRITVVANSFEASNGGRLISSTGSNFSAGTITLRDLEQITLSGRASGIFANTSGNGRGGTVNLRTQTLNLSDGAALSTNSEGNGRAGNISISASEQLRSENGSITTRAVRSTGGDISIAGREIDLSEGSSIRTDVESGAGDGGNITVNADSVRLQDDSDIQTRVSSGSGSGGDIAVTADSVLAFDDSDIITEAPNQGGNITLDTPAFFGAGYQEGSDSSGSADGNGRVDLDASGELSAGTVQTPDTSFIQNSLSDLPEGILDPDSLIADSCIARTETGGSFLITGSGGLPPNRPGTAPPAAYPTDAVRATADREAVWQPGDPIVEPQGVYRLPDGELILSHECR